MTPLMLYIHIPFCQRKCHYCDFLSAESTQHQRQEYVDALCQEITMHTEIGQRHTHPSIFFGGGTPSILTPTQISQIFDALRTTFPNIEEAAEITLELNPGTADREKLETYKNLGINRLSIGLQATNNQELENLGRIHTYETFLATYHLAREVGFTNINIDLMSAIPGQTLATWEETLDRIIRIQPEHISAYSLIVEEGTPYHLDYCENGPKHHLLPPEEEERQMYYVTQEKLKAAGYHRYEISNYAKKGLECTHNLGYWDRTPYLGLGLGASSLQIDEDQEQIRTTNISDISLYLEYLQNKKVPHEIVERLTIEIQMEEYIFLGLRTIKGISIEGFKQQFKKDIQEIYKEKIQKCITKQLIEKDGNNLKLTTKGIDLSNIVLSEFI